MLPGSTTFPTPAFQVLQLRHMKLLMSIVILNIVEKAYKKKDKRETKMM